MLYNAQAVDCRVFDCSEQLELCQVVTQLGFMNSLKSVNLPLAPRAAVSVHNDKVNNISLLRNLLVIITARLLCHV